MIKYMCNIREAAHRQRGFAWRAYDEQFRLRQEVCKSSWAVINTDLWWRCTLSEGSTGNTVPVVGQRAGVRQTPCLDFNKGQCNWANCRFAHVCSHCGSPHAFTNCFKKQRESFTTPQTQQPFRGTGQYSRPRFQRNTYARQATATSKQAQ